MYIDDLQRSPDAGAHVECAELCKTLAGNPCPLLTITDFQGNPLALHELTWRSVMSFISDLSTMSSRPVIVASARVHPGESNSSWMMEGFIEWLTSEATHAQVRVVASYPGPLRRRRKVVVTIIA